LGFRLEKCLNETEFQVETAIPVVVSFNSNKTGNLYYLNDEALDFESLKKHLNLWLSQNPNTPITFSFCGGQISSEIIDFIAEASLLTEANTLVKFKNSSKHISFLKVKNSASDILDEKDIDSSIFLGEPIKIVDPVLGH
jgi:hypothetical protein